MVKTIWLCFVSIVSSTLFQSVSWATLNQNCEKASAQYGIVPLPTESWGFAPVYVETWWLNNGCSADNSEDTCQTIVDTYGVNANVMWGYAPAKVQAWWIAHNCNVTNFLSPCQDASNYFGIIAGVSWGFAPPYVQRYWIANNCSTSTRLTACQIAAKDYGISAGGDFGFAPNVSDDSTVDVQSWWEANSCSDFQFCQTGRSQDCWRDLSGPNYSQVAVGSLPFTSNRGIVCAVTASNSDHYGGSLHCYNPEITNGSGIPTTEVNLEAVGGAEASSPFFNDTNMRMESIAISGSGTPQTGQGFLVYVLRSDSELFVGYLPFPYFLQTMSLDFSLAIDPVSATGELLAFRSISVIQSLSNPQGIQALDTSGRVFSHTSGGGWILNTVEPQLAYLASSQVELIGASGLSHALSGSSGDFIPAIPESEQLPISSSDPNLSFYLLGRTTPVTAGPKSAWMLTVSGKILHSFVGQTLPRTLSDWLDFSAAPFNATSFPENIFPWSIADASGLQGFDGEFFVIGGAGHLLQYVRGAP
jgi:hypothetical protein